MQAIDDLLLTAGLVRRYWILPRYDRWPRSRLEAHQAQALRLLRTHAYAHSRFYACFHAAKQQAPLDMLPVLTKTLLMEHFDEIVTDPAVHLRDVEEHLTTLESDARFRDRYRVNATSGSTGRRGIFLFDRSEWLDFLASWTRGHAWTGRRLDPFDMRIALVASTVPWHMSARVGASFGHWVRTLCLDAGRPIAELVAELTAFQPRILVAFPSVAGGLAGEQIASRLQIAPELIFTGAEVLSEQTRQRVEAAWGTRLFDQYAATEGGGLAAECEQHQGLHLFEDRVIFEVVDADDQPAPPGIYGQRLLITVLGSRTLPLIRYALDDSVRLNATPCPCGRPYRLIDGVQGRSDELLTFPGVSGANVVIAPIVFYRLMDLQPVHGWQVVQEPGRLRIRVCRPLPTFAPAALAQATSEALRSRGVVVPTVSVEEVTAIPRGATSKAVLVTSAVRMRELTGANISP
jgi:phenylacetate-coenzyme A ligase PaaK-like adenylate-forming protein